MPQAKTIHWNPPEDSHPQFRNKTRCGIRLSRVQHREDITDVTCNRCIQLNQHDSANGV